MLSFSSSGAARHALSALLLSFGLGGCSLLQDLSINQCDQTSDCHALGEDFSDTVCEANLCVTPESVRGTGGENSTGGGGETASGGSGPVEVECTTNKECIDDNFGSPFICRDEQCVPLTIPAECPIVLGAGLDNENLKKPEPLIFGVYSYVDPTAPRLSVPTLNYELAIDEINAATRGGIPGGPDGSQRPFIAIVCSGTNQPDLDKSLGHLIDTVGVPAVISSLYTRDLLTAFQTRAIQENVFFLSPLEADSTLTSVSDKGLMWHMLSPALDLSPAYLPLLEQTEGYVRTQRELSVDDKIKVALLESKTPFLTDMADDLLSTLSFNGLSALQNEQNEDFIRIRMDSNLEVANPDTSAAQAALLSFRPDILIALTSGESVGLLNSFDALWDPGWGPRPFYLMSPYVFGRSDLADPLFFGDEHERMLGINFGAAEDSTLYDLYLSKLQSTYDVSFSLEGAENFYDAAYFLMYSMVGAGDPPRLTGKEVALGMTRLLDGKTEFNVGSKDVNSVVGTLRGSPDSSISLIGTMGPPDFNTSTGARRGAPTVYCIDDTQSYRQNVMTYDSSSKELTGSPPCIADFPN